jgi:cell wall-associated NlpC family hydrolase
MATESIVRRSALLATTALLCAGPLQAQRAAVAFSYGRWWRDEPAVQYGLTYHRSLLGPVDFSVGAFHLDDSRSPLDRTLTGGELALGVGRLGSGLYGLAAAGLGIRHSDGNTDAVWSVGAGYTLRIVPFLSIGFEGRYRVEDSSVRGFWQLDPADRDGFMLLGRITLSGRRRSGARPRSAEPPAVARPPSRVETGSTNAGVSEARVGLAGDVVETALAAMGSPYRWGGSDANGYDCSGLIQWAYGEHGIVLPRISRDQSRQGALVEARVDALRPGDILGFSESGGGVTHVGLYVGGGDFIHSSSAGVRLSSLTARDPDSRWWQQRWVTARRILN